MVKRLLEYEWEVIAGIVAAVTAVVLNLLGVLEANILLAMSTILIATLVIHNLRRERTVREMNTRLNSTETKLGGLESKLLEGLRVLDEILILERLQRPRVTAKGASVPVA